MLESARPVIQWLLDPDVRDLDDPWMFGRLAQMLCDRGIPLSSATTTMRGVQSEIPVRRLTWRRGAGAVESALTPVGGGQEEVEAQMLEGDALLTRLPLSKDADEQPFAHCKTLAEEGGRELVVFRLPMSRGHGTFAGWVTDREGGFDDDAMALLDAIVPALSLRLELSCAYHASSHLLETYLGRRAAGRVRQGDARRGHGEQIGGALWLCTLRGFAPVVDERPMDRVLRLLDTYLECISEPILEGGGEILDIAGDAVLAIFPTRRRDAAHSCRQALESARRAFAAAQELNADRRSLGATPLAFRIALHLGVVTHGSVAAGARRGFVLVGPAVNDLRRVDVVCRQLGKPLLMTEAFARCVDDDVVSVGRHTLPEAGERALFTLGAYGRRS